MNATADHEATLARLDQLESEWNAKDREWVQRLEEVRSEITKLSKRRADDRESLEKIERLLTEGRAAILYQPPTTVGRLRGTDLIDEVLAEVRDMLKRETTN